MHPHRRHRRRSHSRDALAGQTPVSSNQSNNDEAAYSPANSSGVSSMFASARRRWGKIKTTQPNTDTLLPTTYSSASSQHMKDRTTKTCNSFLMGGHYYPGKDKKRRNLQKKTFWYKIFCSSPIKRFTSFMVVLYLLFWHGLVPMGEWLVQVGSFLSSGKGPNNSLLKANWLQYDSALQIPPLRDEQLGRLQVASERARLQFGSPQRHKLKLSILENIVPQWYHRNDNKKKAEKENPIVPVLERKNQKEGKDSQLKQSTNTTSGSQHTTSVTSGGHFPQRTLQTMDNLAANYTSCPIISSDEMSDHVQTTLVVQTSINRLWILNETCSRWMDPIVVVVFVPHDQHLDNEDTELKDTLKISCSHVHLILYLASKEESESKEYPVNRLRNVGLDAVTTSHIMVVDVDFLPSQYLQRTIRHTLKQSMLSDERKQALIVPAFERIPPKPCETESDCASYLQSDNSFLPHSFSELQTCVKSEQCAVFQSKVNWDGHFSTHSEEWIQEKFYKDSEAKILKTVDCFHSARYEPYVVLRWCPSSTRDNVPAAPHYDERFHGYGKNKIELISHLRKIGYQFSILPEGFIVHNPHPESEIKDDWNNRQGSDLHSSMDKLYVDFLNDLEHKYKDVQNITVGLCKKH